MLLKTGVILEPLTDKDMYEMIERGFRGGMCQVSHKETIANNKYMTEDYADTKPSKLILNLMDKTNYVIHIKALQYYLKKGVKLKQIHRAVKFKQRAWLKPWIDFKTGKRKDAKSDFEKDMVKLMDNTVYGKTMENVRNHRR